MNKHVRHLFHKDRMSEEMGLEFEASADESARVRDNACGKEYRDALKKVCRATEEKRK